MSSMRYHFHARWPASLIIGALLATVSSTICHAQIGNASPAPPTSGDPSWPNVQARIGAGAAQDASVRAAINEWRRLRQSDTFGFDAYSRFLIANPGWPDQARMRRLAETSIDPLTLDAGAVIRYFDAMPPTTAVGHARHAQALAMLGRPSEGRVALRAAWTGGTLTADDEQRLLSLYLGVLTMADHDQRADRLLWNGQATAAERMLDRMSPTRRPVIAARIAFQKNLPDATARMGAADPIGVRDAGYLADKAGWLRKSGNSAAARELLAERPTLEKPPIDAEEWLETLLTHARAAGTDGQWSLAFKIASRVDDAFAPGTDVSLQSLGIRDDYTSLTWLAGTAALDKLGRPQDAIGQFERYAAGARAPSTVSKGHYWAGRAALTANRTTEANGYLTQAAAYADQFYGQLALERLGRTIPAPAPASRPIEVSAAQRAAFADQSLVRAARLLGEQGQWKEQTEFVRAIAASATGDRERMLAAELAQSMSRPDLGVMIGRRATADGMSGYALGAFPRVSVPGNHRANWTMIHAIARQESQFDRDATSHAGARGLMQLMPGTAREQAGKLGLAYDPAALRDPDYNIQLGSGYFQRMLAYYNGSYPLAVAAYNAGPGNVNKWIRANGDPRLPGSDIVRWIESIPIFETRNYVQRVLENAVVYDLLHPDGAQRKGAAPLSAYLGKQTPG